MPPVPRSIGTGGGSGFGAADAIADSKTLTGSGKSAGRHVVHVTSLAVLSHQARVFGASSALQATQPPRRRITISFIAIRLFRQTYAMTLIDNYLSLVMLRCAVNDKRGPVAERHRHWLISDHSGIAVDYEV
ncbi:MAG: hypothetical protein ACJAR2_003295 [Ilumatobacter sp.]|jgi:hypothetical protein